MGFRGWEFNVWSEKDFPFENRKFPFEDRDFPLSDRDFPFENFDWDITRDRWEERYGGLSRQSVGDVVFLAGVGLISPGISYFHVPWTGGFGIAFNIVVGGGMIIVGAHLSGRQFPTVDREKLARGVPRGASPMVWGLPGYFTVRQLVRRVT